MRWILLALLVGCGGEPASAKRPEKKAPPACSTLSPDFDDAACLRCILDHGGPCEAAWRHTTCVADCDSCLRTIFPDGMPTRQVCHVTGGPPVGECLPYYGADCLAAFEAEAACLEPLREACE